MTNCAGAILAGGKSSRMARDKASLRLRNQSLLQYMSDVLEQAGLKNIYISHPDVTPDILPEYGPLSGIHSILQHVLERHNHIVFVPIDMPRLTPKCINCLKNAPTDVALVHYTDYKMPFRLGVNSQYLSLIESLLLEGKDFSLGNFFKQIQSQLVLNVEVAERTYFQNINTADEWSDFLAMEGL